MYVPADPPRAGALAVWGDGQGPDEIELVLPAGGGVRHRRVRGRLPAASPGAYGAWRVGPLDAADLDWLRRVAAAMPPEGHGLPVDGRGRPRLRSPEGLIRELWDAIADTLVRTPAAVHATGPRAFAAAEPVRVDELADWLAETDRGLDAGAQVQLRVELPAERDPPFAAVVQVRGVADPSLVVDAGELWNAPAAVLARLGERAETDLLLALRRGARAWPPLAPLRSAAPTEVSLDEEQVAELLETGAEALGGAGIEVLWPAELLGERLSVRATVATPAPAGAAQPAFRLQALLSFDWTTPGLLGPLERFRRSVAVPVERYRDADATERLASVVRPFLLRRRKSDPRIAPELPAKTETDRVVPLTAEQATLYEAVVRETLAKIAASEGIERRGLVLGLLTALKQICNHPAQFLHEPAPWRVAPGSWPPWTSCSRSSSTRARPRGCSASTSRCAG